MTDTQPSAADDLSGTTWTDRYRRTVHVIGPAVDSPFGSDRWYVRYEESDRSTAAEGLIRSWTRVPEDEPAVTGNAYADPDRAHDDISPAVLGLGRETGCSCIDVAGDSARCLIHEQIELQRIIEGEPAQTPLAAVLDAAATYAAPWANPGAQRVARQVCIGRIEAALDRCNEVGVTNLVFELAFRLALRDQP